MAHSEGCPQVTVEVRGIFLPQGEFGPFEHVVDEIAYFIKSGGFKVVLVQKDLGTIRADAWSALLSPLGATMELKGRYGSGSSIVSDGKDVTFIVSCGGGAAFACGACVTVPLEACRHAFESAEEATAKIRGRVYEWHERPN